MAKKVIVLLLLAAVAVGLIMYFQGKKIAGPSGREEIIPLVATGNVADLVNALFSEILDEQLTLGGEADDKTLLFSDSFEADAFSQSADENEL